MEKKLFAALTAIGMLFCIYSVWADDSICPYDDDYKYVLKKALIDYLKDPKNSKLSLGEVKDMIKFYLINPSITDADCSQGNIYALVQRVDSQVPDSIVEVLKTRNLDKCYACPDGSVCGEQNAKGQTCTCKDVDNDGKSEFCYLKPIIPPIPTCEICPDGTLCGEENYKKQTCTCKDTNKDGKMEYCFLKPPMPPPTTTTIPWPAPCNKCSDGTACGLTSRSGWKCNCKDTNQDGVTDECKSCGERTGVGCKNSAECCPGLECAIDLSYAADQSLHQVGTCCSPKECSNDAVCLPTGHVESSKSKTWICIGGKWVENKCAQGEKKYYACPDGSQVEWCTCNDNVWSCINSPENQCKCAGEGENTLTSAGSRPCCSGLTAGLIYLKNDECVPVPGGGGGGICIKCGNGQCGPGENKCNCPQDCPPSISPCPAPRDHKPGEVCAQVVVWAKNGKTGNCCEYAYSCEAPDGWKTYTSKEECQKQSPICLDEGQKGPGGPLPTGTAVPECCAGLTKLKADYDDKCTQAADAGYTCGYCGNGQCGPGEDKCNCPQDCICGKIIANNADDAACDKAGGKGQQTSAGLTCVCCAKEGEGIFSYDKNTQCCAGLTKVSTSITNSEDCKVVPVASVYSDICIKCGDGICDSNKGEHKCNCPKDCACKKEGQQIESAEQNTAQCCTGLTKARTGYAPLSDGTCGQSPPTGTIYSHFCIRCGDGICNAQTGEDKCNCPQDCPPTTQPPTTGPPTICITCPDGKPCNCKSADECKARLGQNWSCTYGSYYSLECCVPTSCVGSECKSGKDCADKYGTGWTCQKPYFLSFRDCCYPPNMPTTTPTTTTTTKPIPTTTTTIPQRRDCSADSSGVGWAGPFSSPDECEKSLNCQDRCSQGYGGTGNPSFSYTYDGGYYCRCCCKPCTNYAEGGCSKTPCCNGLECRDAPARKGVCCKPDECVNDEVCVPNGQRIGQDEICMNGQTVTRTCNQGDKKEYTCPDGSQVGWCTCNDALWSCTIAPEKNCVRPCLRRTGYDCGEATQCCSGLSCKTNIAAFAFGSLTVCCLPGECPLGTKCAARYDTVKPDIFSTVECIDGSWCGIDGQDCNVINCCKGFECKGGPNSKYSQKVCCGSNECGYYNYCVSSGTKKDGKTCTSGKWV